MKSTLVRTADVALELTPESLVPVQRAPEQPTTIQGWLKHFGDMSPNDIATFFKGKGLFGIPRAPHACLFAVFFNRLSGQPIHVNGRYVHVMYGASYELPASCRDFIRNFDMRIYGNLIAPTARTRTWVPTIPKRLSGAVHYNVTNYWDSILVEHADHVVTMGVPNMKLVTVA